MHELQVQQVQSMRLQAEKQEILYHRSNSFRIGMIPLAAKEAGFAIARIMFAKPFPKDDYSLFEVIYDEIASGHHTYGRAPWTRFIAVNRESSYWYKRVQSICFAELRRKEKRKK